MSELRWHVAYALSLALLAVHTQAVGEPVTTASAPATALLQPVLSAQSFRSQWNDLVHKLAAMGDSEQAQQVEAKLLLGQIQPSTHASLGQWQAQCGDGDQIWFSASAPNAALTRVVIETPATGTWTSPGRIAPAVMWTMSLLHPERSQQAIQTRAVQLMQGLAKQQSSEITQDGEHYRLSASPTGTLHFEALPAPQP